MSEWNQALWLAKFEVKASIKEIIILVAVTFFIVLFFKSVFSDAIFDEVPLIFDIFFLLVFWVVPASFRPKEFQLKKLGGDIWVSPYFITLNQLPITKNVLVMSRFITYFIISIPFYVLVLFLIYTMSSAYREVMPIGSYLVFSIIWICYGIVSGSIFPASDVGEKIGAMKMIVFNVLFYGAIAALLFTFYFVFDFGIVAGTMYLANEWPLLSVVVSAIVASIGFLFSKGYIYKRIDKVDYLH